MKTGIRVNHKTLGTGTTCEYLDLDGTTRRSDVLKACNVIFVLFDGKINSMQVDIEALEEIRDERKN